MKDKEYSEEYVELILGSNKGYAFEKDGVDPVSRIKKRSKPPRGTYGFRQPTFSELAQHYEKKVVEQAERVAFFSYWPSYSALDYGQRQWYFYWRGKVRSGEYLDTDDSYIYLHAYELLAGVGWRDTEDGAQQICRLLNAYGASHQRIFQDLVIWLFDFCILNKIPIDKEAYMAQFQYANAEEVFSSWFSYSIAHKFQDMCAEALFRMAEVPLQLKIVEDDVLSKALVQGFVELDSFLLEKTGKDIIAGCGAYEETSIQRFAYPNALKEKQYMLQIPFIQYLKQPSLVGFCREYIQIFTLQASLQKTLRNFSFQVIKPDMKKAVERICMRAIRDVKHPPLKIKLQSDNLQTIRENAIIATQRLAEAQEDTTQLEQGGEAVCLGNREAGNTEYFGGIQQMRTAEEADDGSFCSALSQEQRQILLLLYHQPPGWYAKLEQLAEQEGELREVLLDRINALFFQYYDDFCLDLQKQPPELYPEYRDAIRDACPFLLITDETEAEI